MTCYIITFDVADASKQHLLESRLMEYETYCPIHKNCWALLTEKTAVQVRDHLMEIISSPDKIFIIKSGLEAAWNDTYGPDNTTWLKDKL
jgi:hypothetical protein